jgi:hypothetical protein
MLATSLDEIWQREQRTSDRSWLMQAGCCELWEHIVSAESLGEMLVLSADVVGRDK